MILLSLFFRLSAFFIALKIITMTQAHPKLQLPDAVRQHRACADFIRYHKENRQVFGAIITELYRAKEAGKQKASVKAIVNWLRWNMYISSSTDEYKINDKYTGIYTHIIIHNFPDLAPIIETRELRAINPEEV